MIQDGMFIIGAGSMAEAFIRGVTEQKAIDPQQIQVINRSKGERLKFLQSTYGVRPAESYEGVRDARFVVVAVKPADVALALQETVPYLDGQLVVSFAAGVTIELLEYILQGSAHAIRTMPNIPVAVLAGVTAVSFGVGCSQRDKDDTHFLLSQVGQVAEVPEDLMDAATALSGSGPGFVSYFLEAMENAAVGLGFSPEQARSLLLQTIVGTAHTLKEWGLSPKELRERVTSPGGTTNAGLTVMRDGQLEQMMDAALQAAATRAAQMGRSYAQIAGVANREPREGAN